MGVTIHFRGSLNNKKQIQNLIGEVQDICESMNWTYDLMDEDWSKPSKLEVSFQSDEGVQLGGHAGLKGISFQPHQECESVKLTFDNMGQLNSIINLAFGSQDEAEDLPWVLVKTQFAGAETHISILKLLKYLKNKYINNLEVIDEGNYWETEDDTEVHRRMSIINNAMSALEQGLQELEQTPGLTEEGIMKKIEEVIEKLSKQDGVEIKIMRIDKILDAKINEDPDLTDLSDTSMN